MDNMGLKIFLNDLQIQTFYDSFLDGGFFQILQIRENAYYGYRTDLFDNIGIRILGRRAFGRPAVINDYSCNG